MRTPWGTYSYTDITGEVAYYLQPRAFMARCMKVDEAKKVVKDRSRWRSVVSLCMLKVNPCITSYEKMAFVFC